MMAESLGGTLKKEPVNRKVHPPRAHPHPGRDILDRMDEGPAPRPGITVRPPVHAPGGRIRPSAPGGPTRKTSGFRCRGPAATLGRKVSRAAVPRPTPPGSEGSKGQ